MNCVNKARPKIHCNGKCQMMKKLQQEDKKDQQYPEQRKENKHEIIFSNSFYPTLEIPAVICDSTNKKAKYISSAIIDRSSDIFHPPQNCSLSNTVI